MEHADPGLTASRCFLSLSQPPEEPMPNAITGGFKWPIDMFKSCLASLSKVLSACRFHQSFRRDGPVIIASSSDSDCPHPIRAQTEFRVRGFRTQDVINHVIQGKKRCVEIWAQNSKGPCTCTEPRGYSREQRYCCPFCSYGASACVVFHSVWGMARDRPSRCEK